MLTCAHELTSSVRTAAVAPGFISNVRSGASDTNLTVTLDPPASDDMELNALDGDALMMNVCLVGHFHLFCSTRNNFHAVAGVTVCR